MNSDTVKGEVKETTGKVKDGVGGAIGNESMRAEGAADKVAGAVQKGIGEVKDAVGNVVEQIKK